MGMLLVGSLAASLPVVWSWAADRPPVNWALRLFTRVFWVTASGAWPVGAASLSGVPWVLVKVAVAVSVLALPSRKLPPLAASAIVVPPKRRARVTATTEEGRSERSVARRRRARWWMEAWGTIGSSRVWANSQEWPDMTVKAHERTG